MSAIPRPDVHAEAQRVVYEWATARRWTEEQYLLFANDENALVELSDGRLVIQPMPTPEHQSAVLNLAVQMRTSRLGKVYVAPVPVRLSPEKYREPDLVFFTHAHMDRVGPRATGVPDVVVEVLSPSTRHVDLGTKMAEYAASGVREYWVVDLEARDLAVYRLAAGVFTLAGRTGRGEHARSEVLADVAVDVAALFE